jgi:hypothetical protein
MGTLEEIRDILKSQSLARGQQYSNTVIVSGGAQLLKINFLTGDNKYLGHRNVSVPQQRLYSLNIHNDGPAVIRIGTASYESDNEAPTIMNPNDTIEVKAPTPSIEWLNLVSASGNASVRLIGTI